MKISMQNKLSALSKRIENLNDELSKEDATKDMERYKKISGVALDNKLIDKNIENGLITVINNNLIATQRGRIILNTLIKDLLI